MRPVETSSNLTSKVYDVLRDAIVSGEMAPGQLYSAYKLSDQLGVSRTPIREALLRLAEEGMVVFERNRGIRVLQTDVHDLEEIGSLRLLLEVPATHRAASLIGDKQIRALRREQDATDRAAAAGDEALWAKHDRRFHTLILEASGNHRLSGFVDRLRDHVHLRGVSTVGRSRSLQAVAGEHHAILAALEARDPDAAAAAMRAHLVTTSRLLISQQGGLEPDQVELPWADYVSPCGHVHFGQVG